MSNTKQNNEIEHIDKEICLLQDRLKINEKSKNLTSKWVNGNRKNTSKTGAKGKSFSKQKMQNIVKNIFQNTIKYIEKKANLLRNTVAHVKKERDYLKKA